MNANNHDKLMEVKWKTGGWWRRIRPNHQILHKTTFLKTLSFYRLNKKIMYFEKSGHQKTRVPFHGWFLVFILVLTILNKNRKFRYLFSLLNICFLWKYPFFSLFGDGPTVDQIGGICERSDRWDFAGIKIDFFLWSHSYFPSYQSSTTHFSQFF